MVSNDTSKGSQYSSLFPYITPSPWTCQPFLPQGSTGAAYRISDFPCFADKPHGLLMNSVLSYYFGRIPFPLKQKRPLNYTIKFICFSPGSTKWLFFGSGKQRPLHSPLSPVIIFQFFCILSRKTPYYHGNSYTNTKTPSSFRACIISPVFQQHFPSS